MKKRFNLFAITALLAGTSLFTACKEEVVAKKYAQLNVVQTSPDAPGINVALDSINKINDYVLQYGATTGYRQIEAVKKVLNINRYLHDSIDKTIVKAEITPKQGEHYTMFIIDSFKKLDVLYTLDQWPAPESGKAEVRFVHLSPNGRTFDVARKDGAVVFTRMAFKDITSYIKIDAGVHNWELRRAGSDTLITKLPTMVFNTGKVYTVYARGLEGVSGKSGMTSAVIVNQF